MRVPYFDLTAQYASIRDEVLQSLDRACRTGSFIQGDEVVRFERDFAAYCESKHCVALNSGTSALHLVLLAAGVGAGDEVITSANSFIATAETICYTGARPVFVDIDPRTGNLDPARLEAAVTPRSRAIVPVHLYGRPADLDPMLELAARRGLKLIEDACQAHGARYQGRRVGSMGYAAAFSFYPGKNLGAYGEGGALVTNDDAAAALARRLRDHGQSRRYYHSHIGYNYRMDGFQGAVLNVKLKRVDAWTARRREYAAAYRRVLAGARLDLPEDAPGSECAYHLFVAYVDDRDRVRDELDRRGVGTAIHYPVPIHLQEAYDHLGYKPGSLPATEQACSRVLSLPLYPELTLDQVEYAARSLAEVVGR